MSELQFSPSAKATGVELESPFAGAQAVSGEWYRALFAHSLNGILLADLQTSRILAANPAACQILGYTEQQLLALHGRDVVDSTDPRLAIAMDARARTGEFRGELLHRRADGASITLEVALSVFSAEDGKPVGVNIFTDVTERKKTEMALRASEQRLSLALEATSEGLWDWNIATGEVLRNDQWFRLFGYEPGEMPNTFDFWTNHCHPDDRGAVLCALDDYIQGRVDAYAVEHRILTKTGAIRWQLSVGKVVAWDGEGRPARMVGTDQDITERKLAELALRRSEEKFAIAFRASPVGMIISRRNDGCIVDANAAYCEITGYMHDELVGRTTVDLGLYTDYTRARIVEAMRATGHLHGIDLALTVKSGATVEILGSLEAIDLNGEPCFLSMVIDITDRKHMEQDLRRLTVELEQLVLERTADLRKTVAELERANVGKDAFMAAVSHELRTPLTGIMSMTETLLSQRRGGLNGDQQRYVGAIQSSSERLRGLVDQILNYTAAMAADSAPQLAVCRLSTLCAVSVENVLAPAAEKRQTITTSIDPVDLQIETDSEAIIHVLTALLDNAVKFTPCDGQIGIDVRTLHDGASVQLAVWDTGIGIAAEDRPYLFKPFTQADQRLARQFAGIGLGLAYAKRKVEMLGGTIDLAPVAGPGSRFVVTLPASKHSPRIRPGL